ncbi:magnesium transporter CorA family protein [Roseivivax sediminis]|uniref:Magnesium transport protein CorA n=1 Tax=Roseivivax sediminis TaxID=936889 RepID=A0A1I1SUE8_9RHOB|nr:magnesium transporter CorA family protein [Roseivivax sediminis]SFD50016.1 magnesium transporter [Roseivivax sediminis]
MIRSFTLDDGRLNSAPRLRRDAVWIDLIAPTAQEAEEAADLAGVRVPSRADMEEIEVSSRLYLAGGAAFMTAILPAHTDGDDPDMAPVSFVLSEAHLLTVRHHTPRAFETFPVAAARGSADLTDSHAVLVALLEALVDRLADILERAASDIDAISRRVFRSGGNGERDFQAMLEEIGRKGDLTSNMRDSLVTLDRLARFLGQLTARRDASRDMRDRLKVLSRDVGSLLDHAGFLSQKITFLLDATLGMISIEQNAIIKIFSVVAVMLMPPTLIASVYGMNFEHMPELGWPFGYPLALALMVVSAIVPWLYFRRRGWL